MRILLALIASTLFAVGAAGCTYEHHDHYPSHARDCYRAERVEEHHGYYRGDGGGYHHHGYYGGGYRDCR